VSANQLRALDVLKGVRFTRELVLLCLLIVLVVVLGQMSPVFFTVGNLLNTSRFFVEVGLIALGMTLIIITGGIDLSVGAAMALVAVTVGLAHQSGVPMALALVLGLAVGLAAGLFNGLMITRLDLHPLVVGLDPLVLRLKRRERRSLAPQVLQELDHERASGLVRDALGIDAGELGVHTRIFGRPDEKDSPSL